MKQKTSTSGPDEFKNAEIKRIIDRITKEVQTLPLETMISSVWFPGESPTGDLRGLESEAVKQVKALAILAGAGSEDAVTALRNIGNLAAKELYALLPSQQGEARAKASRKASEGTPGSLPIFLRPVVEIQGDLSVITKILEEEAKVIRTLSADRIQAQARALKLKLPNRRRVVANALEALGFPPESLADHLSRTSETSVHYKHPDPILEQELCKIGDSETKPARDKRQECALLAMIEVTGNLIEEELADQSSNPAGKLTSNSHEWPLCVSAFENDMLRKFESLNLGTSLRFRPRRTSVGTADNKQQKLAKKTGRPKLIKPGEPAKFALEYCIALDNVRRKYVHASVEEKEDWKHTVDRIEENLKSRKGLIPPKSAKIENPDPDQSLRMLWTYKSAFLPEFPSANPKGDRSASADLQLWISAAVARARMICCNDWDCYHHWPACVKERLFDSRERSAQTIVREKLKEGMERLEPETSAARWPDVSPAL